ncbi:MAG TPA: extracellular solute-binding protein [Gaiellaceae bacterium]|jgi:maltose-binding protein MalE|nr:extracellular solute-binding protein [Gaiellaceae bacterium]
MKVGRRYAILLAVGLAAALSLLGARATPAAHAGAKVSKLTIWVDNVQKPAITKVANAWGTRRGVDVNVVFHSFGNIRDDLKTVKAENAPDVIVAAHDWTGDLAANGLVLPLFPTKALKKQFPKYALDAFSYSGRLYGAPYALENVGLVVNTRLAKVPKTWAQLEKAALAFKRKSPDNLAIAVPQGSGGDAYHMYPFFSGLGGFVFGHAKNGALQANKLGVANKTFLKNAPLIDRWNREGLINSKVDYGTAKNAWLKGNAAFWITGPWEIDGLKASGNPFRVVQLPRIKYRSVPFLGVQGTMVTKFAQAHGVESLAKDLVANEMMKASFQLDLEQANLRFPANKVAGKRVNDPILKQFGAAGLGGVPMPNIPQMGSVWAELGGAWVKATKGAGATPARTAFAQAQKNIRDKIAGG